MKTEFLKGLGLEQDAIDKIMAENGKDIESFRAQVETLKASETGLKGQLAQRDKDLTELKKNAGDSEDLKTKYDDLESTYKADKKAFEDRIRDTQISAAIKVAVAASAHDPDLVVSQIDKSKITLGDDGSVKMGLDEQVKELQKTKAFLFKAEGEADPGVKGGAGPASSDDGTPDPEMNEAEIAAAFGLTQATAT
jgi:chromosome segregation ATPase